MPQKQYNDSHQVSDKYFLEYFLVVRRKKMEGERMYYYNVYLSIFGVHLRSPTRSLHLFTSLEPLVACSNTLVHFCPLSLTFSSTVFPVRYLAPTSSTILICTVISLLALFQYGKPTETAAFNPLKINHSTFHSFTSTIYTLTR